MGDREQGAQAVTHTAPCGCVVTERRWQTHTKMCAQHRQEAFQDKRDRNRDLVGG